MEQATQRLAVRSGSGVERIGLFPLGGLRNWLYADNGRWYSDDGKKVAFNSKEGPETLTWILQLLKRQGVEGHVLAKFNVGGAEPQNQFMRGERSMHLHTDNLPGIIRLDPVGKDMSWGVTLLPTNDKNPQAKLQMASDGGIGYSVTSSAKNAEGAWALTKFLAASEAQCAFMAKEQGRVSALKRCNTDPEVQKRPEFKVFAKEADLTVSLPFTPAHNTRFPSSALASTTPSWAACHPPRRSSKRPTRRKSRSTMPGAPGAPNGSGSTVS